MHLVEPPLSLYVHIPWCVRKCPYCDFNSHQSPAELPQQAYADALMRDLDFDLAQWPELAGRPIVSVFFGGGTPSLFSAQTIAHILAGARARLSMDEAIEVTLETNPGTVEHDRFEAYRDAGISRVSFGIQSFDDDKLARLGRIHDSAQALRAVEAAQQAGITEINLDLMYALPEQSLDGALADIRRGIELGTQHLSHYQLTLEPNTLFAARPPALPDTELAWDMQEACQAELSAAGCGHYEVSAYARPGHACRHNLNYWTFGDYLGIGAGAHAKLTRPGSDLIERRWKLKNPRDYMAQAGTAKGLGGISPIAAADRGFEFMLNALRLMQGFDLGMFERHTGLARSSIEGPLSASIARGLLVQDGDQVTPTAQGAAFLNDVVESFLQPRSAQS